MTGTLHPPAQDPLLDDLTATQREAVCHDGGPLLIVAGAGTGKTTVISRRLAWLVATGRARADEILALTFTEKAAAEMQERVDLLLPYGYVDTTIQTFHAFGDALLRDHALRLSRSAQYRVLSQAEQLVFLRRHVFDLPLTQLRPLADPTRHLEALAAVFARAKDEAVTPEEFQRTAPGELAEAYGAYQRLLREADAVDFGDQVLLVIELLEQHPDILAQVRRRFRYVLVDEFQDTNYAQFRLLQLLAPPGSPVTVVADDDQSIYKWRGAAISNVLKFLEHDAQVRTVVLTENFRSSQAILDAAYRLIRGNDPDRLEVRSGIPKRLTAQVRPGGDPPHLRVFDTVSSESDWVARTIREAVDAGSRRPGDFAILVRSNREAEVFLRALNVAGLPWQFSGTSGLLAQEESKVLLACLKALADPEDSLSWHHVAASALYRVPMADLTKVSAAAHRRHRSLRAVIEQLAADEELAGALSGAGRERLGELAADVRRLLDLAGSHAVGQLLYRWLSDRGVLAELARAESAEADARLRTTARFFDLLRRLEELAGHGLAELLRHFDVLAALGDEPAPADDLWADRVSVLTLHKAKGLEFPVVFMVGLVQGRFPTVPRRDPLELPAGLIKDILPAGDHHLQEERRLFYVGMTRAKETLYLTAAYSYGGKTVRKVSQFVLEALDLPSPSPAARAATARELIERSRPAAPALAPARPQRNRVRLDPHGADDYRTCPLKYRFSHVLRAPVMRHHLVIYGAALHKAIETFFRHRLEGREMDVDELLGVFQHQWRAEGFLTRTHEEQRFAQGRETLRRFHARQQAQPERPTLIEQDFRFPLDDMLVAGRWDRVDREPGGAVIIDYKSSDVADQRAADRKTRESFQLLVYALAWRTLHGELPLRVELRFLESGLVGTARFDEDDLTRVRDDLRAVAAGVGQGRFPATPSEHACRWCAFQTVCPSAFH
jgi:DNA helicase-2/ATP-dependent DNA helicase PcrA